MTFEVKVKQVPVQQVVSIRQPVLVDRLEQFLGDAYRRLEQYLERQGAAAAGPPMAIYHGAVNADQDGPVEACIPMRQRVAEDGSIYLRELDGGRVAYTAIGRGLLKFPEILAAYEAVHDWIGAHGYATAGPPREVYVADVQQAAPDAPVCEITWPIR